MVLSKCPIARDCVTRFGSQKLLRPVNTWGPWDNWEILGNSVQTSCNQLLLRDYVTAASEGGAADIEATMSLVFKDELGVDTPEYTTRERESVQHHFAYLQLILLVTATILK